MFNFGTKTEVNKVLKLSEVLKSIKADKNLRAKTNNISEITITNVLNKNITGLSPSENIVEIYFFEIILSDKNIPYDFIKQIDKSILFQTVYTLKNEENIKIMLTYKTINSHDAIFKKHYEREWMKVQLINLPLNITLEGVFKDIFAYVTGFQFRTGETFKLYIDRLSEIEKLVKLIEKTEREISKKNNPKERLTLHADLKRLKYKKETLC